MKVHWGTGIIAGFVLFVLAILILAGIAVTQTVDLVNDQYYNKGLKYQERIGILQRTAALEEKVHVSVDAQQLTVQLPHHSAGLPLTGIITLYRPSSKVQDFAAPLSPDSAGCQRIPTTRLDRGLWRIQVSWKAGGIEYYSEQPVMIL
jgi:nitrogen fixation protein FixH